MGCMERVYADLIRKGRKTIEDVPKNLRDEARRLLNQEEKEGD